MHYFTGWKVIARITTGIILSLTSIYLTFLPENSAFGYFNTAWRMTLLVAIASSLSLAAVLPSTNSKWQLYRAFGLACCTTVLSVATIVRVENFVAEFNSAYYFQAHVNGSIHPIHVLLAILFVSTFVWMAALFREYSPNWSR